MSWSRPTAPAITRIKDIGRVELGAQTYSQIFKDGQPAAGIGIFQTPGANALSVQAGRQAHG